MKKFLAIPFVAVALAACGGGGGGGSATTSGIHGNVSLSVSGPDVNGHGSANATIEITNVAELNNAVDSGEINGKTSINVDVREAVNGSVTVTHSGGTETASINYDVTTPVSLTAYEVRTADPINDFSATESGSFQYDGHTITYTGSITVDTSSLPKAGQDFDVVEGHAGGADFYITNVGTGTPDHTDYGVDYGSLTGTLAQDAAAAHAEGWTGKGVDVVVGTYAAPSNGQGRDIAPGATVYKHNTYNSNGYAVGRSTTNWGYEDNTFTTDDVVTAATTALVIHKFDTISADQGGDIVIRTRDANNGVVSISKALSPVGNLR